MSEIQKTYEPQAVEEKWYSRWLADDCFKADPASAKPAYSIVIPPPNVTGVLTLGHVLNNTIQDILARRARMLGKEVLWLPGTDHAGIATQTVVERTLKKQGAIRHRDDLGREKFLEKVWEWKEKHGGIIIQQLKKLGASCDWSRERFTMDPEYSKCVQRVFVDLYKKGLIYRGKRMVNWCPVSLTALSDEEVTMKPQNGTLYYFKVEVVEAAVPTASDQGRLTQAPLQNTWLTIATTRPETIPGDTAIAVNPKDARYAHLIGKKVRRPLPVQIPDDQKLIPIIGDEHVDFEFGTGVLKVTPAHDKADFEIGARHGLAQIDIMNPDGTMNALAGESLVGLDRFEARNVAVDHLRELGVLVKEEPYQNNVGYSERADVPVEPRLSEQWFLKYPSVEQARNAVLTPGSAGVAPVGEGVTALTNFDDQRTSLEVRCGESPQPTGGSPVLPGDGIATMRFFPERWAKVYDHWMGGIQDWCISRQLWWGHRIPVWYSKEDTTKIYVGLEPPADAENWIQDPDVLDTWFSSWLWPFATMGWPDKTDALAKFYPTTDLVTGPDIIFFWVARMIMAGFEYMGELPFRNVYFTGIIRDKQGRKMSKSLGNSPDPLEIIAKYGADALRFGVMRSAPLGADILFDEKNVELGRNFCTKLWNAARFRQMQGGDPEGEINPALLTSDDKWILLRLDGAIREVSAALDEYRFSDAANALYRFFWSEYCDWYLEASKAALNLGSKKEDLGGDADAAEAQLPKSSFLNPKLAANTLAVMDFILAHTLRLFHPFLPFITEELWHGLGYNADLPAKQGGETIMLARWPVPFDADFKAHYGLDESDEKFANAKYEVVNLGRVLRRDFNIASNKRVRFVLKPNTPLAEHEAGVLRILLNAAPFDVLEKFDTPKGTPTVITPLGELFLPLEGLIDIAAEQERLKKEIAKVEDELAKVRAKLSDPNFAGKVPAKVLEDHRQREANWAGKLDQLQKMKEALGTA
jgi:valyl-tRNA synthetase